MDAHQRPARDTAPAPTADMPLDWHQHRMVHALGPWPDARAYADEEDEARLRMNFPEAHGSPAHDDEHEHYRRWREAYMSRLDEDYDVWRRDRFSSDFEGWRRDRVQEVRDAQAATPASAQQLGARPESSESEQNHTLFERS
ncbi:hypothetical protein [Methylibium rhizosphaerae]|uniref:hypothetical protein n=1 Tax=Methylibium rhizosphaerae TaxID=2570323 RepID=UPI0011292E9F|nr:hypothetical protein [Methylibium rhizosphaerae]